MSAPRMVRISAYPDRHSGGIRTPFRNYPDSKPGTSGHFVG
ncbi:hypothetical protein [Dehalobacter sp. DCM]